MSYKLTDHDKALACRLRVALGLAGRAMGTADECLLIARQLWPALPVGQLCYILASVCGPMLARM
jgi:hypothetical protein